MNINKTKKLMVKQSILKGKSYKQAVLDAGYAPASAHNATQLGVVKQCIDEIEASIRDKVTVDYVLSKLLKEVETAKKSSDRIQATTQLGKYLAMFTEKKEVLNKIDDDKQESITKLFGRG